MKLKGALIPVLIVVVAEVSARAFGVNSDNLAAPSDIVVAFWETLRDGSLIRGTGQTLYAAMSGLVIGGGLGLVLGILIGLFKPVAKLLYVTVEALRPVPGIALLPVALLVFGFGYKMEISLIAFACFWPVLIIGQAAFAGIEPMLIEVSRMLNLGFFARVTKIVLPAALPRIFIAFRLAAGIALIVAVTTEIVANPLGLGHDLMISQQSLNPALMFANLLWVGVIGWALNAFLLFLQYRLFGRAALVEAPR